MPITWRNRRVGDSKLSIKEMGSRYFEILLQPDIQADEYGDYKKP